MSGKFCATKWMSSERDQPHASRTTPLAWLQFLDRAVLLFELAKPMESLSESWCRQSMTGRFSKDNVLSLGALRKFYFLPCITSARTRPSSTAMARPLGHSILFGFTIVSLFKFAFRTTKSVASHVGNDHDCGRCSYWCTMIW